MSQSTNVQIIKTDKTIKILLAAIAIFLGVIAVSQMSGHAQAQGVGCGDVSNPCYVRIKS